MNYSNKKLIGSVWGAGGARRAGEHGERPHKKQRFLETFLRYFGERMGSGWAVARS